MDLAVHTGGGWGDYVASAHGALRSAVLTNLRITTAVVCTCA